MGAFFFVCRVSVSDVSCVECAIECYSCVMCLCDTIAGKNFIRAPTRAASEALDARVSARRGPEQAGRGPGAAARRGTARTDTSHRTVHRHTRRTRVCSTFRSGRIRFSVQVQVRNYIQPTLVGSGGPAR